MGVWTEPNELFNKLYIEIQDKITIFWILWAFLFVLAIIQLILEFRKKSLYVV